MSRRVPVTLIIHTWEEVPDGFDREEDVGHDRFYIEENHCLGNYVVKEGQLAEENYERGNCEVCSRAKALVGHLNLQDPRWREMQKDVTP